MIGSIAPTPVPEANILYNKTMDGQRTSMDHYHLSNFGTAPLTHTPDPTTHQIGTTQ